MNKLEQAARQALEALEKYADWRCTPETDQTITALREAFAEQAEQEPVAWGYFDADGSFMDALDRQHGAYQTPLYAAPVRTKDLTDDEIDLIDALNWEKDNKVWGIRKFARAVIAADRKKNK